MSYIRDIRSGIRTTLKGLSLTWRHLRQATHRRTPEGIASDNYFDQQNGLVTLQYPHEQLPIPDNGRYRLRNEIDDCIVCDKCAKVCPVDCITIDAIKATEEVGRASDGSPIRLYAAKFDIDMAKCCYCGLCTVVCPTECLTMDKTFDYSEFELGKLTYSFAELTPEEADEKRALYEQFVREKEEAKQAAAAKRAQPAPASDAAAAPAAKRPVFRPTVKPAAPDPTANSTDGAIAHPATDATPDEMQQIAQGGLEAKKRPVFRPTQKPAEPPAPIAPADGEKAEPAATEPGKLPVPPASAAKPAFRPTMKPAAKPAEPGAEKIPEDLPKPKPAGFRPTMKPTGPVPTEPTPAATPPATPVSESTDTPKPRPAFRPTTKQKPAGLPEPATPADSESKKAPEPTDTPRPRPAFRPTMKPKPAEPEPKPAGFRPTMKPKPAAPAPDASADKPASDPDAAE